MVRWVGPRESIFFVSFTIPPSLWRLTRYFILSYTTTLSICCRRRPTVQPALFWLLIILEVFFSRSHTATHHNRYDSSGRVISSSQRPLPDNTQHSQQTDIHAPGGIRTHNLSRRAAVDLRLRPRCHWDRQRKYGEEKRIRPRHKIQRQFPCRPASRLVGIQTELSRLNIRKVQL